MCVVVTGGEGFIGRNLRMRLAESGSGQEVVSITRRTTDADRRAAISRSSFVFHLAGANRPKDDRDFHEVNTVLTRTLCEELRTAGRPIPVVYASSAQAASDNPYGRSKRAAEEVLEDYGASTGARVAILRLWNVFGKWARPNYNSVVATFCHNLARGLPITIDDAAAVVRLVHIDDVVDTMLRLLATRVATEGFVEVGPTYALTVGELADTLRRFAESPRTMLAGPVGAGLTRTLYSTYVSHLPVETFTYYLDRREDPRGVFAEVLRTQDAGQFSFFTAHPGITRGGHYHHTKTEKFLVLKGEARFRFRHVLTNQRHEVVVRGHESRVVETVPGWIHDITNIGDQELIVMLWANEIFDPDNPDTVSAEVDT